MVIKNINDAKQYIETKIKLYSELRSQANPSISEMEYRRTKSYDTFVTKQYTSGKNSYQLNANGDADLFGYQAMTFQNLQKTISMIDKIQDRTTKLNATANLLSIVNEIEKNDKKYTPENSLKKIFALHDDLIPLNTDDLKQLQKSSKNANEYINKAYVKPLEHQVHDKITNTNKQSSILLFEKSKELYTLCADITIEPSEKTKNNINHFSKYIEANLKNKTLENQQSESMQKEKLTSEFMKSQGFFKKLSNVFNRLKGAVEIQKPKFTDKFREESGVEFSTPKFTDKFPKKDETKVMNLHDQKKNLNLLLI